jgi:hypothetical protein
MQQLQTRQAQQQAWRMARLPCMSVMLRAATLLPMHAHAYMLHAYAYMLHAYNAAWLVSASCLQESAPFMRVLGSYPMELQLGGLDSNTPFDSINEA